MRIIVMIFKMCTMFQTLFQTFYTIYTQSHFIFMIIIGHSTIINFHWAVGETETQGVK